MPERELIGVGNHAKLYLLHDAGEHARRVVLVHGINTAEGTTNLTRLATYFEGCTVVLFEYGFLGPIRARWKNPAIARELAGWLRHNDDVVCHSNGAALLWLANQRRYAPWLRHVSLIAPALDATRCIHRADRVDVYHNADDRVVWLSQLLRRHAWGAMGRDGAACGNHTTNFDTLAPGWYPQVSGHLDYFQFGIYQQLGPKLAARHEVHA